MSQYTELSGQYLGYPAKSDGIPQGEATVDDSYPAIVYYRQSGNPILPIRNLAWFALASLGYGLVVPPLRTVFQYNHLRRVLKYLF